MSLIYVACCPCSHHARQPQQGLPGQHFQHPQGVYLQSQSSASSQSPYAGSQTPVGIYPSPHSSGSSLPPQQPQSYPQPSSTPRQVPEGFPFFQPQQSPYSAGTTGSFPTNNTGDMMAAPSTMRVSMPGPMYGTPPSNSPASAHSPHEAHARSLYGPQAQNLYYPTYQGSNQSQYLHQGPMTTQQSMPVQYQRAPHLQLQTTPSQFGSIDSPRHRLDHSAMQRPSSHMGPPPLLTSAQPLSANSVPSTSAIPSSSTQNAAPGPIPATTPLVVKKGDDGVAWLKFEYSRDRIKNMYEIRCDVERVDVKSLQAEFKENNCVYPRACNSKEPYKGNRLSYETECNEVGWALSWLNQELRGKRGLIQRAVDSWRNSATDPKLRSRRVRRMNKTLKRAAQMGGGPLSGSSSSSGYGNPSIMATGKSQTPLRPEDMHHHRINSHRANNDNTVTNQSPNDFQDYSQRNQSMVPSNNVKSEATSGSRQYGSVFPTYPLKADASAVPMSPLHTTMDQYGSRSAPGANAVAASLRGGPARVDEERLFGRMSDGPAEKFKVYSDIEQGAVKITRTLTKDPTAINNGWKERYSVFPGATDDNYLDIDEETNDDLPSTGKTVVPVRLLDGWGMDMEIPNPSVPRRSRERYLNELGYRMSWGRNTEFCDAHSSQQKPRKMYLQRAPKYSANVGKGSHLISNGELANVNGRMRAVGEPQAPTQLDDVRTTDDALLHPLLLLYLFLVPYYLRGM
ncbi:MAG: hypothetical protein M1828_000313 [Chrysothrix sp. TS-e1954]|nr:MAG: hypothetical protein M1828_000313 [Chrysothrix sp. TS-e1954]